MPFQASLIIGESITINDYSLTVWQRLWPHYIYVDQFKAICVVFTIGYNCLYFIILPQFLKLHLQVHNP